MFGKVAGVTGLEPAASGVTGRRSNQLSYTPSESRLHHVIEGLSGVNWQRGRRNAPAAVSEIAKAEAPRAGGQSLSRSRPVSFLTPVSSPK